MEDAGKVLVQKSRCIRVCNRHVECDRCLSVCPADALTVKDGTVGVSGDACVACGACATVCPTEALSLGGFSGDGMLRDALAVAERRGGPVVIACARALDAVADEVSWDKVVSIPCLACIDEAFLVVLAAYGATRATLVGRECASCPQRVGADVADASIASACGLFDAVGFEFSVVRTVRFPSSVRRGLDDEGEAGGATAPTDVFWEDGPASRLAPLEWALPGGQGETPALRAEKDGLLPRLPSFRRDMLLGALKRVAASLPEGAGDAVVGKELWASVELDASLCTGCKACVRFCPTGALSPVFETEGSSREIVGVEHCAGDCVQCGACEAVCPSGAFRLIDGAKLGDVIEGKTARFDLKRPRFVPGKPESTTEAMRLHMNCSQVYTR